jgi:hypothetical protein
MKTFTPHFRKIALTAHITSSVGWFGAVAGWLALAVAALTSQNAQLDRAADLAMELTAWCVIVPLAFAALLTGIFQSMGTSWGLLRHYWVVVKLLLTAFATGVLLLKMEQIGRVASGIITGVDLRQARIELVGHAVGGLLVLLVITTLSVFKPLGMTRFGLYQMRSESHSETDREPAATKTRWTRVVGIMVVILFVVFFIKHISNGGLGLHHGHQSHSTIAR